MFVYRLFGFTLAVPWEIEYLQHQLLEKAVDDELDVTVELGSFLKPKKTVQAVDRALLRATTDAVWIKVPWVAKYLVSEGKSIKVYIYRGADMQTVNNYLLGMALGAICYQRGLLVLRASAVHTKDGVLVFAGVAASGKSTTAAVFAKEGADVLSDDLCVINASGEIVPGPGKLKLWQSSVRLLEFDNDQITRLREPIRKFVVDFEKSDSQQDKQILSYPVAAIYTLATANEKEPDQFEFKSLSGIAKFNNLKWHAYRPLLLDGMRLKKKHLKLCSALAIKSKMAKVIRPTSRFSATELAQKIVKHARGEIADTTDIEDENQ